MPNALEQLVNQVAQMVGYTDTENFHRGKIGHQFREGSDTEIWVWYIVLCVLSAMQITLYIVLYFNMSGSWSAKVKDEKEIKGKFTWASLGIKAERLQNYRRNIALLAWPFVWQCAFRSFFPEIYNERITFWDHWLNSAFLGRFFANIGEMCWTSMVVFGLMYSTEELRAYYQKYQPEKMKTFWNVPGLQCVGYMSIIFCGIAECCCNYSMFTKNYVWSGIEASLWAIAVASLIPYAIDLHSMASSLRSDHVDATHIYLFSRAVVLTCIVFTVVVVFHYIPMQIMLWMSQTENNVKYDGFYEGMISTIVDRIRTQRNVDWAHDWFWQGGYFTGGVWFTLCAMTGPRLHLKVNGKAPTGPDAVAPGLTSFLRMLLFASDHTATQEDTGKSMKIN